MLKREKEVLQTFLDDEDAAIKNLEKSYARALRDIETRIKILQADEMTQSKIYQVQYQQALKAQIEGIIEKLHSDNYTSVQRYLDECYKKGFVGTMYSLHGQGMPILAPIDQRAAFRAVMLDSRLSTNLYTAIGIDTSKLKQEIRREISVGISSGASYDEIARNLRFATNAPLSRTKTIVRTEGHRVQQASAAEARNEAKRQGCDVLKQWDSTLDANTRPTHRALDGQIRETDEPFEADGKKADRPGEFGRPEEDCNCRCVALTRAKWALDADELQTMKERAAFFGLDKAENFKEFEEKYLNAGKVLQSRKNDGIMKTQNNVVRDAIASGSVSTKVNPQKQGRHIKSSSTYIEGRSYLYGTLEDAQQLVNALSGTGTPLFDDNGEWLRKERVDAGKNFGVHVSPETGEETETSKGMLIYSKTGTHLVPRKETPK